MSRKGKRVHSQVVFKEYNQNQLMLPMDIESLIPTNHMVRVINNAIDSMKLEPLFAKYPGGGRSSFHPVMMTKLIVYAYADKVYSSRKIEKAARENIMYMWLCGNNTPDFKTINTFRGKRMKDIILDVFSEIIELLIEQKYINLQNYFLDGTKIEANANKYSWVWGKSTKRYKEKLKEKCRELFVAAELINKEENDSYGDNNLEELGEDRPIDSQAIEEAVKRIDQKLAEKPRDKGLIKAKKIIEKDYLPRMQKYEKQEQVLAERNSYSKTDTDATFMRMKEDHMKNGQLKPGYNVQIGTENQFIVGYSIHQQTVDTSCLKSHIEELQSQLNGKLPENVVADAGYGSEENYEYLSTKHINSYIKYNTFHKEASRKWKKDQTKVQNWLYIEGNDEYLCINGKYLSFIYEATKLSKNGYRSLVRVYESEDCSNCPYRQLCMKQSKNPEADKKIYINRRANELRAQARENLTGEYGKRMRSLRPIEVESVFGNIKGNFGVRRFMLKGLEKIKLEWGLYSIAHNMRKLATIQV